MAALDFPASPALNQIFVGGNNVSYKWNGTLWVAQAGGGSASITVSDTPPVTPIAGAMWWNSVLGAMFIYFNDGNTSQWVPATPSGTNKLLQEISVETGAVATGTTIIPTDDTIPQITEGDQYMTLAITPLSATSKLIIDVVWNGSANAGPCQMVAALFQDATANALAATFQAAPATGYALNLKFSHTMTSGTTSPTTFRVRAGPNAGSTTVTFNGIAAARIFGGVMASSIVIREVTT